MPSRVALPIVAYGAVSAAGSGSDALWNAVLTGNRSGAVAWRDGMAIYPAHDWQCSSIAPKAAHRLDRCVLLGGAALEQAMGNIPPGTVPTIILQSGALLVGSARGPVTVNVEATHRAATRRPLPTQVASSSFSSLSGNLAGVAGVEGLAFTLSAACASGALAIATGAHLLAGGGVPLAIVGGADAPLHPALLEQFASAGVLGHAECPEGVIRPCQPGRNGTALGEGAAFLVLARGGTVHTTEFQLAGWGTHQATGERQKPGMDGGGLGGAIESALDRAGHPPEAIDGVILHATGTPSGDEAEIAAIRRVFGTAASRIPLTALKPVTGHCVGASGALEAVLALSCLRHQLLPPIAGMTPASDAAFPGIDFVKDVPRPIPGRRIMTLSSGFWGGHVCLIFERCPTGNS